MENNQSIKYIGYYSFQRIKPERSIPLAGRDKMNYTINVLSRIYNHIDIISPATISRGETGCKSSVINISDKVSLRLFSMFSNRNRWFGHINYVLVKLKLLLYLLKHTHKGDAVLVYHSLAIAKCILLAHKIKKFKLILEVNEIYSDVTSHAAKYRNLEMKIIRDADAFIFPNDLMNKLLNPENRPHVVEYGIYTSAEKFSERYDDGKIHIVYAGTFDPSKGGAAAAAAAGKLPNTYHMHILGFGSEKQISEIKETIKKVNSLGGCTVSYDGKLDGREFTEFLQKCQIGLSTQNPDAAFNATSFPSKVLTYLANGLQVVSIDIPAISNSELRNDINFYKEQSPEAIAQAILNVNDFTPHFSILNSLDKNLEKDLSKLFTSR